MCQWRFSRYSGGIHTLHCGCEAVPEIVLSQVVGQLLSQSKSRNWWSVSLGVVVGESEFCAEASALRGQVSRGGCRVYCSCLFGKRRRDPNYTVPARLSHLSVAHIAALWETRRNLETIGTSITGAEYNAIVPHPRAVLDIAPPTSRIPRLAIPLTYHIHHAGVGERSLPRS